MLDTIEKRAVEKYVFYHYNPSMAAAVIFIVLFALSTGLHGAQAIKKRTWYWIPFLIGGFFEAVGYIGRALSAHQSPDWTMGPYIIQSLLLLLAPALFAASIYMVLGRIIRLTDGEYHSLIRANWLTKIFVAGDVISFLAQSAGGGLLAKAVDEDGAKLGERIIIAGLFIQVIFFGFFIIVACIFHYRIARIPTTRSASLTVPWNRLLVVLYVSSALILIRSIFRIVEYIQGSDGYILSHEAFLYVFDAVLMFIQMALLNIWHPSNVVTKEDLILAANTEPELDVEMGGYPMKSRR